MKVIGITGGVGSGKSTLVSELIKKYNATSLLADEAAGELRKKGGACYDSLIKLLGEEILDEEKNIDSKKMASKIFTSKELLEGVNDIIHPAVRIYILDRIKEEKEKGNYDYFFLEAALLIECGYVEIVDEMWYIFADRVKREERLFNQRGYSKEKTDSIVKSQLSEEEFRAKADFVVDNSFTLENSLEQIEAHLRSI